MPRQTDVLVVGAGLAGIMAALSALNEGCSVRLVSLGVGSVVLGSGNVDVLAYANGTGLSSPWQGFASLPAEHPYSILGEKTVREALNHFCTTVAKMDWPYKTAAQETNIALPTMVGTLKPTWLVPADMEIDALATAQRVLVLGIEGQRESSSALVIDTLHSQPNWETREFVAKTIPAPLQGAHRSPNTLDIARFVDRPEGRKWLAKILASFAGQADIILLPPICGSLPDRAIRQELTRAAKTPIVEMLTIPPGVGGLRLWTALRAALNGFSNFEWVENAKAVSANCAKQECQSLKIQAAGGRYDMTAKTFILATGGILGGGVELTPGKAREVVCDTPIAIPDDVAEWSSPDFFASHNYARFGVSVDVSMRSTLKPMNNVFFAGRTIGGYDYATEKSGNGVAIATGWQAGRMAAQMINGQTGGAA